MKKRVVNAKEPYELFKMVDAGNHVKVPAETGVWACGECGTLYRGKDSAERCCRAYLCGECKEVYILESYWTACQGCRDKKRAEEALADWEKMPVVEYNGEALFDGCDRFFENEEEALDRYMDYPKDLRPEYLELCHSKTIGEYLSIGGVLDRISEDMLENVEDADPDIIKGFDELEEALKKFVAAQTYMVWEPAGKKVKIMYEEEV